MQKPITPIRAPSASFWLLIHATVLRRSSIPSAGVEFRHQLAGDVGVLGHVVALARVEVGRDREIPLLGDAPRDIADMVVESPHHSCTTITAGRGALPPW
jgi:hypothetical protein